MEPGACFLAAGFYKPSVSYLRPVRRRIADDPDEFQQMLGEMEENGLPVDSMDDTLTGMPQGFSDYRDHDIARYLKWQHYLARRPFEDEALQSPDFTNEIVRITRDALPLLQFVWESQPE